MIKTYTFNYDLWEAKAVFEVDTEKFTEKMATPTLEFFTWDYDKDENPVDEVMKKYALRVIELATFNNFNAQGVISLFKRQEGYTLLDGSTGLKLISVEGYEFSESSLEVVIS